MASDATVETDDLDRSGTQQLFESAWSDSGTVFDRGVDPVPVSGAGGGVDEHRHDRTRCRLRVGVAVERIVCHGDEGVGAALRPRTQVPAGKVADLIGAAVDGLLEHPGIDAGELAPEPRRRLIQRRLNGQIAILEGLMLVASGHPPLSCRQASQPGEIDGEAGFNLLSRCPGLGVPGHGDGTVEGDLLGRQPEAGGSALGQSPCCVHQPAGRLGGHVDPCRYPFDHRTRPVTAVDPCPVQLVDQHGLAGPQLRDLSLHRHQLSLATVNPIIRSEHESTVSGGCDTFALIGLYSSSRVFGQSSLSKRLRERSARIFPPV